MEPFLIGLSFKLKGLEKDEQKLLSDMVTNAGGHSVPTDFPGEVDYLVTPCTDGSSGHRFKQHLSIIWLEDCLDQEQLLDVAYYHQIIQINKELKPMEGVVTGMTGLFGRERQFLKCVVKTLGGLPQDIFAKRDNMEKISRASTHLICPGLDHMPQNKRYRLALKWKVPVVNINWLRVCLREKRWVSESPFLVGDSTFFTPNKPLPKEVTVMNSRLEEDEKEEDDTKSDILKIKIDWMKRIANENIEKDINPINREQEEVIEKLEEVLCFLRKNQVKNEECFVNIKDSVDDVLTSLKFLPTEPSFNILPTEIKSHIFSFLCDSGALVASLVCLEWREIFKKYRMKEVREVIIGEHCSNVNPCQDTKCFMPQEIQRASVSLDLDVPMYNCSNSTEFEQLVTNLEGKSKPIESLVLKNVNLVLKSVDSTDDYNNDNYELIDLIIDKTRRITLDQSEKGIILDAKDLFESLIEMSEDTKIVEVNLQNFEYDKDLSPLMAMALCEVLSVKIGPKFNLNAELLNDIIDNIYPWADNNIAYLEINQNIDWSTLISPEDLKTLLQTMRGVEFRGTFTTDQLDFVRSIPGVQASSDRILKRWPILGTNN